MRRSLLSWPFPRRRSQPAQSTLNHSRSWHEGHWVKPCVSTSPQLTCDNGMSPDTRSNEDPSPSLCHPLPPASSVQMTARMTDLWYDCSTFVLTAPPHLAKNGTKSMWEQHCCPCTDLGQPCGKLPRPDLAKPCLEIPSAAGDFEQWCGLSCPCSLWELHLSHSKDPPAQGKHKQIGFASCSQNPGNMRIKVLLGIQRAEIELYISKALSIFICSSLTTF